MVGFDKNLLGSIARNDMVSPYKTCLAYNPQFTLPTFVGVSAFFFELPPFF
jgi:hypothetical protein